MTEFKPMRRKRQLLPTEESINILNECTSGTLALLGDDGYPYSLPISYVYSNNHLFFHSALSGHKIDAIKYCEKASFCVIHKDDVKPAEFTTYFRSVICFGRIRILEDESERKDAMQSLAAKYNPGDEYGFQKEMQKDFSRVCIICLDIEYLTGKEAIELVCAKKK